MSKRGKYIVFEGIQGSGKSTQIQHFAEHLKARGITPYITREPGGADMAARQLRTITQDPRYNLDPRTEVLIYNAARVQSLAIVDKLLGRGLWVLSDRNYLSTLAVQYYAHNKGIDYQDIVRICEFAVGNMVPDLTIILDVDPATAEQRAAERTHIERFDNLKVDFLQRMRDGYLTEAKKHHYPVVDATKPIDSVAKRIRSVAKELVQ